MFQLGWVTDGFFADPFDVISLTRPAPNLAKCHQIQQLQIALKLLLLGESSHPGLKTEFGI
jgi:hypothetical protein